MKITSVIAFIIVIVGALNWLLVGLFGFDLVAAVFGTMSVGSRIIYSLVGLGYYILTLLNEFIFLYKFLSSRKTVFRLARKPPQVRLKRR